MTVVRLRREALTLPSCLMFGRRGSRKTRRVSQSGSGLRPAGGRSCSDVSDALFSRTSLGLFPLPRTRSSVPLRASPSVLQRARRLHMPSGRLVTFHTWLGCFCLVGSADRQGGQTLCRPSDHIPRDKYTTAAAIEPGRLLSSRDGSALRSPRCLTVRTEFKSHHPHEAANLQTPVPPAPRDSALIFGLCGSLHKSAHTSTQTQV